MNKQISADYLMEIATKAAHALNSEAMSFLFATGKVELILRNLMAVELNKDMQQTETEHVMREWKKHDLVILDGEKPRDVIEGKAWLHADVIHPSKLDKGSAEIKKAFEKDLLKIRQTQSLYPDCNGFITILLSAIDVSECDWRTAKLVSYPELHMRGIKDAGNFEELHGLARSYLTEFLRNRPEVMQIKRSPLFEGSYEGMEIAVDFFVLELGNQACG